MSVQAVETRVSELEGMIAAANGGTASPSSSTTNFDAQLAQAQGGATPTATTASLGSGDSAYSNLIDASAAKYGLDPALLNGLIQQESGFNPAAGSPAGAQGLTQLMPGTAASLGVTEPARPGAVDRRRRALPAHAARRASAATRRRRSPPTTPAPARCSATAACRPTPRPAGLRARTCSRLRQPVPSGQRPPMTPERTNAPEAAVGSHAPPGRPPARSGPEGTPRLFGPLLERAPGPDRRCGRPQEKASPDEPAEGARRRADPAARRRPERRRPIAAAAGRPALTVVPATPPAPVAGPAAAPDRSGGRHGRACRSGLAPLGRWAGARRPAGARRRPGRGRRTGGGRIRRRCRSGGHCPPRRPPRTAGSRGARTTAACRAARRAARQAERGRPPPRRAPLPPSSPRPTRSSPSPPSSRRGARRRRTRGGSARRRAEHSPAATAALTTAGSPRRHASGRAVPAPRGHRLHQRGRDGPAALRWLSRARRRRRRASASTRRELGGDRDPPAPDRRRRSSRASSPSTRQAAQRAPARGRGAAPLARERRA